MIILQLHGKENVTVSREGVHGLIHHLLPTEYHEQGVGTQFANGDNIKAHTFWVPCGDYEKYQPFLLEIRALGITEQNLYKALKSKESLTLDGKEVNIDLCRHFSVKAEEVLRTFMPILVRKSMKNAAFLKYGSPGQKTIYLTYKDNPAAWLETVKSNLVRRAEAIMGGGWVEQAGPLHIRVIQATDARSQLRGRVVRGTRGKLEIKAPWNDIAFNLSLGERCSYGFGVLGGEAYESWT
ncbi:CRISPR associated protein Cas6 [Peptococcaceae bacterium CEB3]|nr:CRISPR associated protein Cas6 [Peptococcaceae bacterium CEB3]